MPKITGLSAQKGNSERVNVYLDGEFAFGLTKDLALGLQRGQELTEAEVDELKRNDGYEEARHRVMNLIGRRPRSIDEIRRYLRQRETPQDMAESLISDLIERGLLDDLKFARAWIENRDEFRPRSSYALRSELRQRGVENTTIALALESFDERRAAERAARKALRKYRGADRSDRVYAFLARRGFPYSMIKSVVGGELAAEGQDESEVME